MSIQFNNYRELLTANSLNSLSYDDRFEFYCKAFPQMKELKGIRDCELVQLYDGVKRGYQLQECIDTLAEEWLLEEDTSYNDLSQELKSFLTVTSAKVVIPD